MFKSIVLALLSLPLWIHAEGIPVISVETLHFAKDAIGFVTADSNNYEAFGDPGVRKRYYELDAKTWNVKNLSPEAFKSKFQNSLVASESGAPWDPGPYTLTSSDGTAFRIEQAGCKSQEEGDPICKTLLVTFDGKKSALNVSDKCKYGCRIGVVEKWGDQIWVGLLHAGEIQFYGEGLAAFDAKTRKRLYFVENIDVAQEIGPFENPTIRPTLIRKDPKTDRIWVGTNVGLRAYDKKFNILGTCQFWPSTKESPLPIKCKKGVAKDQ